MDIENTKKQLGLRLMALRKLKGLKQIDLEESHDFSYRHYGKIERGEVNASLETLLRLSEIFDVSLSDLFSFTDDEESSDAQQGIAASVTNILKENDKAKLNKLKIFLDEIL